MFHKNGRIWSVDGAWAWIVRSPEAFRRLTRIHIFSKWVNALGVQWATSYQGNCYGSVNPLSIFQRWINNPFSSQEERHRNATACTALHATYGSRFHRSFVCVKTANDILTLSLPRRVLVVRDRRPVRQWRYWILTDSCIGNIGSINMISGRKSWAVNSRKDQSVR